VVGPLLKAGKAVEQQTDDLDRKVLNLAHHDAQVRTFMTVPGVGPAVPHPPSPPCLAGHKLGRVSPRRRPIFLHDYRGSSWDKASATSRHMSTPLRSPFASSRLI
jgi:hypothetical protein